MASVLEKKNLESNPMLIQHNLARTIPTNDSNGSMEAFKHELHIVVEKKRDAKIEMRRGGVEQAAAAMLGQSSSSSSRRSEVTS